MTVSGRQLKKEGGVQVLDATSQACAMMVRVSVGDDLLEQRRRARRAGDPRLSAEGRVLFRRMTTGDLIEEFQADLDAIAAADPILSGEPAEPAD